MWIKIYALFLTALSLCAFIAYAADKSRAKKGARRIPERVLLALSLSGGRRAATPRCSSAVIKRENGIFTR